MFFSNDIRLRRDLADRVRKGLAGRLAGRLVSGEEASCKVRFRRRTVEQTHLDVGRLHCRVERNNRFCRRRNQIGDGLALSDTGSL